MYVKRPIEGVHTVRRKGKLDGVRANVLNPPRRLDSDPLASGREREGAVKEP